MLSLFNGILKNVQFFLEKTIRGGGEFRHGGGGG